MLGHIVRVYCQKGVVQVGDLVAPQKFELHGTLHRIDAIGVVVYDEKQKTNVFVPMENVVKVVDDGIRPS